MVITEVRVKLMEDNNERLSAFCSVTLDNMFVIRDLKIIEGAKGMFVAMPSRKLTDRCPKCRCKNHLRARFCNQCGARLDEDRATRGADGRAKLHADIAHPINCGCREVLQDAVLRAFEEEKERARQPGYVCRYDDYDGDDYDFAPMVADLPSQRTQFTGYRTPAARPAPRDARETPVEECAAVGAESREFGAGIF